jgi:Mlc titration factor MtfA (ptsG expression regulator)
LTDEIRITIAAQACLLLLHRKTDYYPQLSSILVYPTSYIAHEKRHLGANIGRKATSTGLAIPGAALDPSSGLGRRQAQCG